jgi:hypothetical protein
VEIEEHEKGHESQKDSKQESSQEKIKNQSFWEKIFGEEIVKAALKKAGY